MAFGRAAKSKGIDFRAERRNRYRRLFAFRRFTHKKGSAEASALTRNQHLEIHYFPKFTPLGLSVGICLNSIDVLLRKFTP
jgi:hypothetical protein